MRMRKLLLILLLSPIFLQAQIVNIEKLRSSDTLDNHVSFEMELGFGISKNSSGQVIAGNGSLRTDYYFRKKNKLMLIAAFGVNRFKAHDATEATSIEDNQFAHLRYNRTLTKYLTWEAFAQGQFNEVELINLRILAGTGPRFKVLKKKKGYIYLGTMYMFEHSDEQQDGISENLVFDHHRLSNYVSMLYEMSENAAISHVTYYQPRVDAFDDFRISSETGLEFKLFKKLKWKSYFLMLYDSRPPESVVELRYQFRNGISLAF